MLIKERATTSCPQQFSHIISPQIAPSRSEQLEQCFALTTNVLGVQFEDVHI
jgi:hypothetical protein